MDTHVETVEGEVVDERPGRAVQTQPVTFGAVAGKVLENTVDSIGEAIREFGRLSTENARLLGIVEALTRENAFLRSMIDKVIK